MDLTTPYSIPNKQILASDIPFFHFLDFFQYITSTIQVVGMPYAIGKIIPTTSIAFVRIDSMGFIVNILAHFTCMPNVLFYFLSLGASSFYIRS